MPSSGPAMDALLRRFASFLPHLAWHVTVDLRMGRRNARAGARLLRRLARERAAGCLVPRTILRVSRDAPPAPPRGLAGVAQAVAIEDPSRAGWMRAASPGDGLTIFRIRAGSARGRRACAALLARHPGAAAWIEAGGPPRGRAAAALSRLPETALERVLWREGPRAWYRSDGRWTCDRTLFAEGAAATVVTLGVGLTIERDGRRPRRIPAGPGWIRRLASALEEDA